jgi:hypothetical protein
MSATSKTKKPLPLFAHEERNITGEAITVISASFDPGAVITCNCSPDSASF